MLREIRRRKESGTLISVSGADPLNLAGILTPGPKLAALTGNRVLYRDGAPVAMFAGGEVEFLETLDPADQWDARKTLLRGASRVRSTAWNAESETARVEHELERQA
jgi:ATP-dependent Lhr-like helicase